MDLMSFVAQLERDRMFEVLVNAPQAQLGTEAQPYLGASIMPERQVPDNAYRETAIRYMTTIAGWGTRYSPVQRRDVGEMYASFMVELGEQDIGADFTSRDYDALVGMLRDISGQPTMDNPAMLDAANRIFQWADVRLLRGVLDLNERDRFSCMIAAQVVGYGSNGTSWTIDYANPAGHRANAGGSWADPTYDPLDDIFEMNDLLIGKGYTPTRMITSTPVLRAFQRNAKVIARYGLPAYTIIPAGASISGAAQQLDITNVNAGLQRDNLPGFEVYDRRYRDTTGLHRFMGDNNVILLSTTGRDDSVPIVGGQAYLPNTAGYFAIGRSAGQSSPGRVLRVTPFFNKPPRLEGECWQTGLPVFTEPESIAVIKNITTS